MSRFLSEALGANEPRFRQAVMGLERRKGHPNYDIRLTSTVMQNVRSKLNQLGLDSEDTTAEELYYCLNHKLKEDDSKLLKTIRSLAAKNVNAEANLSDGLKQLIKELDLSKDCLAIKPSVVKKLLKASPPKKAMKALGYRSVDSMLKLEPMPLVLLAINNFETESYVNGYYVKYKKLTSADLEPRKLAVIIPSSKRWQKVLSDIQARTGLTLVSSYELAAVVVLPLDNQPKSGYTSMLVAKLLSELSVIYSVSTYLKLHQVNADFGSKLFQIAEHEPYVATKVLDQQVSWQAAQHVLGQESSEVYGPHASEDDMAPVNLMSKLSDVLESYAFWADSEILALVESTKATSLNILDVATNLVNELPFEARRLDNCRHALMQELMKLYISPEQLIEALLGNEPTERKVLIDDKALAL